MSISIKQEPDTERENLEDFDCNNRDLEIDSGDNGDSIPSVKTEHSIEEKNSALPNIRNSQKQRVGHQVRTLDFCGRKGSCNDKTDLLQKKETSSMPGCVHSLSTYVMNTPCGSQVMVMSIENNEEITQMEPKSDLNTCTTDTCRSSGTNSYISRDIKDVHKFLPNSDDVFPNQHDTERENLEDFDCNNRDLEIDNGDNGDSIPSVKTEHSIEEENSALPNIRNSQKQRVGHQVSTLDFFGWKGSCNDKTDLLQKKETSSMPGCVHSLSTYVMNTPCGSQVMVMSIENNEEITQMEPKSDLNTCTTDTCRSSGTNSYISRDIKDVHKFLPNSDDVFPNQHDKVKVYRCGTCQYSSNHLFDLYQHIISHGMENVYTCDLCQSSYKSLFDLKCHLASHTTACALAFDLNKHEKLQASKTRYSCEFCSYTSTNISHLEVHQRHHTSLKPYLCDLCSYAGASATHLRKHMKHHTGEKPYFCELCSYTCKEAYQLKRHKRRHTGEKPYSCDLCSYAAATAFALVLHKRRHTGEKPYSCDLCSYVCASTSALSIHKKRHTGEKPYLCDLCSYAGVSASALQAHKRRHTGEKPYSCDLCSYTCARAFSLKDHRRRHDKKPNKKKKLFL